MQSDTGDQQAITFAQMRRFTVNEHGKICLDGHPIETQKVRLTKWQAFFATAAAIGAALGGLSAFATLIQDWLK